MSEIKKWWNNFVKEHGPRSGAFLHSYEWGEFQKSVERTIYRYALVGNEWIFLDGSENQISNIKYQNDISKFKIDRNDVQGVAQTIKMQLPLGKSYLYVSRGPIINSNFKFQISDLNKSLGDLARKEKAIFVKVELPIEEKDFNEQRILNIEYRISHNIQPKDTLLLDIGDSEEELMANMHEKTRYNIRLAEKKGVQVRWSEAINSHAAPFVSAYRQTLARRTGALNSDAAPIRPPKADRQTSLRGAGAQDLENFWKLAKATAKRDKFSYHQKNYYKNMLSNYELRITDYGLQTRLVLAEKDGKTLAANIVAFFGDTVTYLHGASNYAHRELMAPHLLQWRTIQEAKRLGYRYYDFWGIAPISDFTPHQTLRDGTGQGFQTCPAVNAKRSTAGVSDLKYKWSGITRFKMGFGGEAVSYAPSLDFPIQNVWYRIYRMAKKLRS